MSNTRFRAVPEGTKSITRQGYVAIKCTGHPRSNMTGWALEHSVIASQQLGRKLRRNEHVHHIDGNKRNNSPQNLRVMLNRDHFRLHREEESRNAAPRANPVSPCLCGCGGIVKRFDKRWRKRSGFLRGHGKITPEDRVLEMFKLYQGGLSLEGVGKIHGVSGAAIWHLFKTRGLPRRNAKESHAPVQ